MYDTGYMKHKCGAVQDFCTFHDTKIFYCIFCKKVISAKRDPEITKLEVTVIVRDIDDDKKQNEYDDENLKEWA